MPMQSLVLKFNAPSNKDLLKEYQENNQYFNGRIFLPVEIDFIQDFGKNDYMNLVRQANDEYVEAIYYERGLLHLDFNQLIIDVVYTNTLEKNGKKLLSHKYKNQYENDGLFITDPNYYIKEKVIKGYDLTYPDHLNSDVKKVKRFMSLLKEESKYTIDKKRKYIEKIEEDLSYYKVKVIYNVKKNENILEEASENHREDTIVERGEVKLMDIVKNDWYYIQENIAFNGSSEIYLDKGRIIFDFRHLVSDMTFINLLGGVKDFKYEPSKPYLFKMIKENPYDYVYLFHKEGYQLDEFEAEFGPKKKIRLFMEEFKRKKRYFKITPEQYKNAPESSKAYALAAKAIQELSVSQKNAFSRKLNFFLRELLIPTTIALFTIILLIYFVYQMTQGM